MRVKDFNFTLPQKLIAQRPAEPRESARLLDLSMQSGGMADRTIADLPKRLREGDVLVVNNTQVLPSRLRGRKGEGAVEVTLHQHVGPNTWAAFAKPAKKLDLGTHIEFQEGLRAETIRKGEHGEVTLHFNRNDGALLAALKEYGQMPLPPYIKREKVGDPKDAEDYQTMFARRTGAVAAPTAGLHFTPELIEAIKARGVEICEVTLHVGAGTFLPVKVDDTDDHKMHSEWGQLGKEAAAMMNNAKRVVAVGTTAARIIETAADDDGIVSSFAGETDLFIVPGYKWRRVDVLMTNFHLPCSTLFMLVCAFAGKDAMVEAYKHAKKEKYRFYSYGDATLLKRASGAGITRRKSVEAAAKVAMVRKGAARKKAAMEALAAKKAAAAKKKAAEAKKRAAAKRAAAAAAAAEKKKGQ